MLRALIRQHPLLSAAFALALMLTLFFGVRAVMFSLYWADPAHRDRAIEGWMTPGYVAQSWDVPRPVMEAALAPLPEGARRPTLEAIAAAQGVPLAVLVARLEGAIAAHRQDRPQ